MSKYDGRAKVIPLCILSQAEGGGYVDRRGLWDGKSFRHQPECPLGFSAAEARAVRCPCKAYEGAGEVCNQRERIVGVRVLACRFPETWDGDTIRNPQAFAAWLRRQAGLAEGD
jgi:hypothetical protein